MADPSSINVPEIERIISDVNAARDYRSNLTQKTNEDQSVSQDMETEGSTASGSEPTSSSKGSRRLHTLSELNESGDEYLPAVTDSAGEKKVQPNGQLCDGRVYRLRTFTLPNRGDKLFMIGIECAKVLGYRDAYLLFNENPTLYKVFATSEEKDFLIAMEILPHWSSARQIAIVTARSMYRCFDSRIIQDGRRVRDDYWEAHALKKGYTEEDPPRLWNKRSRKLPNPVADESNVAKDIAGTFDRSSFAPTAAQQARDSAATQGPGVESEGSSNRMLENTKRLKTRILQRHTQHIAKTLVEATGVAKWGEAAIKRRPKQELTIQMEKLLKEYAADLLACDSKAEGAEAGKMFKLLDKWARYTANHFWSTAVSSIWKGSEFPYSLRKGWTSAVKSALDSSRDLSQMEDGEAAVEQSYSKGLPRIHGFESTQQFARLKTKIRRQFYYDETGRMADIERHVLDSLKWEPPCFCPECGPASTADETSNVEHTCNHKEAIYDVSIWIDWTPEAFLRWQFGSEEARLGSVVTITGSAFYAYATTASTYMQKFWPRTGDLLLDCVQHEIEANNQKHTEQAVPEESPSGKYHKREYVASLAWANQCHVAFRSLLSAILQFSRIQVPSASSAAPRH